MSSTVRELLLRHFEAGTIPGAVALVAGPSDDAEPVAVGSAWVGGPPLRVDAIMRIQSMTKPIAAVAALRLVEAGRLALDESLAEWLPELARPRVLTSPEAELDDTVPADRAITLRHLLTCTSGYGMILAESPLQRAMAADATEAGPSPIALGAGEWLGRLAALPLAFQPGEGWRYHHSFGVLGVLLSRVSGKPAGEHLAEDLFGPLGMSDTAYSVPVEKLDRLPAAYRFRGETLEQTEQAAGGFYAAPSPFDLSHAGLVSTAADYLRFLRVLTGVGVVDGVRWLSTEHLQAMTSDQVPAAAKTSDSFFPGFWDVTGWGFGVGIELAGLHKGRYGWSGGQGTNFFVDPDGTVGILLTQVEMGERMAPLVDEFQQVG